MTYEPNSMCSSLASTSTGMWFWVIENEQNCFNLNPLSPNYQGYTSLAYLNINLYHGLYNLQGRALQLGPTRATVQHV